MYDNYNALVFGISATGRTSDAFVSVTAYPKWITLFFLHGGTLHDPQRLLEGSGKQVRGVRLNAPDDINSAPILALLDQAKGAYTGDFAAAPALSTVIKLVAAKQRPRRPAASTRARRVVKPTDAKK